MADYFSGIKPITPTYPVRPGQPANKDSETGKRKKKEEEEEEQLRRSGDDPGVDRDYDDKPAIDEHV